MTTESLWRCWWWLYLSLVLVDAQLASQPSSTPAHAPKNEAISSPGCTTTCTGDDADAPATETSTTLATALTAEQLRERIVRFTDELNRAQAAFAVECHREKMLNTLEMSKYCYVNTASDKVSKLMSNLEHVERVLMGREEQRRRQQLPRTERPTCQPGRRLQLIRRLLTGAETGLVHMDSVKKLHTGCNSSTTANVKNVGCGRERRTNSY